MKAGWTKMTLDEACHFSNGLWKGEKDPLINVGVIRNTNFRKDGSLDDSEIAYLDVEAKKFDKRRLQFGDIILEKSGGGPKQPVGRVALFDKQDGLFSFSNFTSAVRVKDPKKLDFRFLHKFLYWTYLSGVTERMQSHSTGIRNLDANAYKSIEIAYPPIPEQQRIVAILDEAFEAIAAARANVEQNRQNARALFESYLQSVFSQRGEGWVEKPLGEIADLLDCLHKTPTYAETGFPMVRVTDVKPGFLDLSKTRKVDEQTYISFSKGRTPRVGDIVFSRVGSCGVSALVNSDEPFCLGQNTMFILPKMNSVLLYHFLNSPNAKEQFEKFIEGTTQPTISMKSIRQVVVPIAPPAEHQSLVDNINALRDETQRLESLYQRKIAALDELKQSLLQQAFSGNL